MLVDSGAKSFDGHHWFGRVMVSSPATDPRVALRVRQKRFRLCSAQRIKLSLQGQCESGELTHIAITLQSEVRILIQLVLQPFLLRQAPVDQSLPCEHLWPINEDLAGIRV